MEVDHVPFGVSHGGRSFLPETTFPVSLALSTHGEEIIQGSRVDAVIGSVVTLFKEGWERMAAWCVARNPLGGQRQGGQQRFRPDISREGINALHAS